MPDLGVEDTMAVTKSAFPHMLFVDNEVSLSQLNISGYNVYIFLFPSNFELLSTQNTKESQPITLMTIILMND